MMYLILFTISLGLNFYFWNEFDSHVVKSDKPLYFWKGVAVTFLSASIS